MAEKRKTNIQVNSEIGKLEAVIIHSLGSEVENMTPENAERALYSDILNLSVAQAEYSQFRDLLKKVTEVYEVKDLLSSILNNENVKSELIQKVCVECIDPHLKGYLQSLSPGDLARKLIEGVPLTRDSLSRFLSPHRFAIRPLHNFFFTRDSAISIYNNVLISKMASPVREREAQIMEAIFNFYPDFSSSKSISDEISYPCRNVSLEGGDVLIGREDLLLIGIGSRTTADGVDVVVEKLKERNTRQYIIVQELPTSGESFIHLDMVFTFLNKNECMVYEPVIMQPNRFKTILITIENGTVGISEEKNIPEALSKIGLDIKPIYCGGITDPWTQEREQWHSGANFFALEPGKVIGYSRNTYTIEELAKNGYEVIKASDIISDKSSLDDFNKCVVTIEGSELARGGGGARCMSMPVRRKDVEW